MRKGALLCLLCLTLIAACGKKEAAPAAQTTTPAPAAKTEPAATTEIAGFGVPECDDYIKRYLDCVDAHVPGAMRAQVKASLDATRASWQQAASTPEGKAGLAAGCRAANDAARAAMSAYGCTF